MIGGSSSWLAAFDALIATVNGNSEEMKKAKSQLKDMQKAICGMAYEVGLDNKELRNDLLRLAERVGDVLSEHFTYTL